MFTLTCMNSTFAIHPAVSVCLFPPYFITSLCFGSQDRVTSAAFTFASAASNKVILFWNPATHNLMNLLSLWGGSANVSIDLLIKLCYRDSRQPAQLAAFRDASCCVWVNKVMCLLNGCNTVAGGAAVWWQHWSRHFDCQSNRLEPKASQCD